MATLTEASKLALRRLRQYTPPTTAWPTMPLSRRAAVLILLFPDRFGELRVVLTMRASTLSSYSGQAALPGGKADSESESAWDVSRREAREEIGLPTRLMEKEGKMPKGFWVEELCEMPTNLAKTELIVRPCVAVLHNSTTMKNEAGIEETVQGGSVEENMLPQLDAREVAAVFSAPFRNFLYTSDLRYSTTENTNPSLPPGSWYQGAWIDWHQQQWRMHNFFVPVTNQPIFKPKRPQTGGQQRATDQLEGLERYKVWGMTARILVDAARYAYNQEPEFEHNAHFGDEGMIARLRKIGRLGDVRKPGDELTRDVMREAALTKL